MTIKNVKNYRHKNVTFYLKMILRSFLIFTEKTFYMKIQTNIKKGYFTFISCYRNSYDPSITFFLGS